MRQYVETRDLMCHDFELIFYDRECEPIALKTMAEWWIEAIRDGGGGGRWARGAGGLLVLKGR